MIPSRSRPAWGGGVEFPGGTPTNWTPHGVFVQGFDSFDEAYTHQRKVSESAAKAEP